MIRYEGLLGTGSTRERQSVSDTSQGDGWWQAADGKWYPPEQHPSAHAPPPPSQQPAVPPPPQTIVVQQKSNTGKIIGILGLVFCILPVLAIIGIGIIGAIGSDDQSARSSEASGGAGGAADEVDDVTLLGCARTDGLGLMEAEVEITNNSSKLSSYWIEIQFESLDGSLLIGEGRGHIENLDPGQTTIGKVTSDRSVDEGTEFQCELIDVERSESL